MSTWEHNIEQQVHATLDAHLPENYQYELKTRTCGTGTLVIRNHNNTNCIELYFEAISINENLVDSYVLAEGNNVHSAVARAIPLIDALNALPATLQQLDKHGINSALKEFRYRTQG